MAKNVCYYHLKILCIHKLKCVEWEKTTGDFIKVLLPKFENRTEPTKMSFDWIAFYFDVH